MSQAAPQHGGISQAPLGGGRLAPARNAASDWPGAPEAGRLPAFIAGPENRLLVAVMNQLIAQLHRGDEVNRGEQDDGAQIPCPLLLIGPHGSGKTHLARGIVELWRQQRGDDAAECLTAADFGHQLSAAIHRQGNSRASDDDDRADEQHYEVRDWRRTLRRRQVLAIDDIHRLGPAPAHGAPHRPALNQQSMHRQTELRNTLDAITQRGGLLLLTATGPLAETTCFDRPLLSRLTSGLTLEIAPPGRAARRELLDQAAAALGCQLDGDALETLAERLPPEPPRVLRAAVELRRRAGTRIDVRAAERLLEDDKPKNSPPVADILRVVARYHKLPLKVLTSASRRQSVVAARAVAIYLARELTPLSYAEIGAALGGRDHTTIMHNYRRIDRGLAKDRALRSAVEELRRLLSPL